MQAACNGLQSLDLARARLAMLVLRRVEDRLAALGSHDLSMLGDYVMNELEALLAPEAVTK